jgi:hydrogenase nickel incorporation protein HypB
MRIKLVENVLGASAAAADDNRRRLDAAGALAVNVLSAPGSGKTTLLEHTIPALGPGLRCAVLVGDLQTTRDAERLGDLGAPVVQINTGRGCHLSPAEVARGLDALDLAGVDLVFIENVGNMVCPASFDLGEHLRAVLLSTPEGDDKVGKYPILFQTADVIVVTKTDLIDTLGFALGRVREDLSRVNTGAPLILLSNRTQEGMAAWLEWLRQRRAGARPTARKGPARGAGG